MAGIADIPPDLQQALGYYGALPNTPSALGAQAGAMGSPSAADIADLQNQAGYYDALGKTAPVLGGAPPGGLASQHPDGMPAAPNQTASHPILSFGIPKGDVVWQDPDTYGPPIQQGQAQAPTQDFGNQVTQQLQKSGAATAPQKKDEPEAPKKINFVPGAAAGAGAQAPGGPLDLSALQFGGGPARTVAARDVQVAPDLAVQGYRQGTQERIDAAKQLGEAEQGANEIHAQGLAGRAGQLQHAGDVTQEEAKKRADAEAKAIAELNKHSEVDPNHYMSTMSTGKRLMLTLSAGLMQMGMGLQKQGGPNPVLEQIEKETQRDVEAQKSKFAQKMSVFHQMREAGLDAKQAVEATQKYYLEAGANAIEAGNVGAQSPILAARAADTVGQLHQMAAGAEQKFSARVQAQTIGGSGINQAAVVKRVQQLRDKAAENGKDFNPQEAWRQALEELHPGSQTGGFSSYAKATGTAGAGRNAAAQVAYQQNLSNLSNAKGFAQRIKDMIAEGGQMSPTRTARGKQLVGFLQPELANALKGSFGDDSDKQHALSLIPKDPNAYNLTGANAAMIDELVKFIDKKMDETKRIGPQVASGQGFQPVKSVENSAQESGAEED
jgi:hypothetical protein